jgi:hypothetical protein
MLYIPRQRADSASRERISKVAGWIGSDYKNAFNFLVLIFGHFITHCEVDQGKLHFQDMMLEFQG